MSANETSKDPEPVMIPVTPRFDEDGEPTCERCAFSYRESSQGTRDCALDIDEEDPNDSDADWIPGPNCPVHHEQAREKPL